MKFQANQQGRNTLLGKLCCQPHLLQKYLVLCTAADPSYCIITQEAQIFRQSLTFRIMKYSPTKNCPENHVTRLALHFQIKYFLIRQYRPCQQNWVYWFFCFCFTKSRGIKIVLIMPKYLASVKLFQNIKRLYFFTCIHGNEKVSQREWISDFWVPVNLGTISDVPSWLWHRQSMITMFSYCHQDSTTTLNSDRNWIWKTTKSPVISGFFLGQESASPAQPWLEDWEHVSWRRGIKMTITRVTGLAGLTGRACMWSEHIHVYSVAPKLPAGPFLVSQRGTKPAERADLCNFNAL